MHLPKPPPCCCPHCPDQSLGWTPPRRHGPWELGPHQPLCPCLERQLQPCQGVAFLRGLISQEDAAPGRPPSRGPQPRSFTGLGRCGLQCSGREGTERGRAAGHDWQPGQARRALPDLQEGPWQAGTQAEADSFCLPVRKPLLVPGQVGRWGGGVRGLRLGGEVCVSHLEGGGPSHRVA